MKGKRILWWTLLAIFMVAGWWTVKLIWLAPFNINHFYERAFIEFALKNPELLSALRLLEPYGLDFHNDDLNDASDAFAHQMNALIRKDLKILRSYDKSKQTPEQQLSTNILEWFLENQIQGQEFMYHNYPLNQLFGEQNQLPTFLATIHQIDRKNDAENYITRLSKVRVKLGQVLEGVKLREKKGIIPPKFVLERVLDEMKRFVAQDVEKNILYTAFVEKVSKLKELNQDQKKQLYQAAKSEIEKSVYAVYRELISYYQYLLPIATTDDGVWKLPDGARFYAWTLRDQTTTNMSPEEIHRLGISEVDRIQSEMRQILDGLGLTQKSVAEHMDDLGKDSRFLYPETEEARKQCLRDYQSIIDEIDTGLSEAFNIRPKIGVRVERIPQFREKTAPGAYYDSPSLDGKRPGIFYANLRDMKEIPKWGMRTLSYHEAIPGHHFQLAIQQELQGVPTFRKIIPFTAYSEGWALYAERVAWELGFQDDPYNNLGRLQAELFRAVRLVVDTGIHHKKWKREEAIRYMLEKTGMAEGDVVAEIERYIVNPGQACAYKIGQLKILELREKAKKELGDRFDLKEFHNEVLRHGAMPLEILEEMVNRYINTTPRAAMRTSESVGWVDVSQPLRYGCLLSRFEPAPKYSSDAVGRVNRKTLAG